MPSILRAQAPVTLNGAVQFNDDHAFNRALIRFEELVKKYYGKPINFTLHKNSSLGLEKQYFEYMSQGKAVDYGIVSPAHMSTFAKAAPFIDAPFVFKGIEHMNKVVEAEHPGADRRRSRGQGRGRPDRLCRRRHPQHLRQQAAQEPRRSQGSQGARAGRADLVEDVCGRRHEPDRDRLQRSLQRHPERRDRGRRKRGGRRRGDEVLRSRAASQPDPARGVDPADLLLGENAEDPAEGLCRTRS